MRRFIIGDVHGCFKTLKGLINQLPLDYDDYRQLVFVGDLIDRGRNSRDVLNFIRDNNITCVQGNHEAMMVDAYTRFIKYEEPLKYSDWCHNGGVNVLDEYTTNNKFDFETFSQDCLFVKYLPKVLTFQYNETKDLLVSHSGALDYIDELNMVTNKIEKSDVLDEKLNKHKQYLIENIQWERVEPLKTHDKYFNVFGHSPIYFFKQTIPKENLFSDVLINKNKGYANVDLGCVYKKPAIFNGDEGKLVAIAYPDLKVFLQKNIED